MLAPIYNAINTLLVRITSARATLLDNLSGFAGSSYTSARGGKIDYLDAAVSSRAAAGTAVSNADYTAGRAAKLDQLDAAVSSRMAGIKLIQRGSIHLSSVSSATATVTAVNTAKAELRFLGYKTSYNGSYHPLSACRVTLTNSTTVTAERSGSSDTGDVSWELVEYY